MNLRQALSTVLRRLYGKANTPRAAAAAGPARKQMLMKKKKAAAPVSGQAAGQAALGRISALTDALFEPSQPVQVLPDPAAPDERAILVPYERADTDSLAEADPEMAEKEQTIRRTWARFCAKKAYEERGRESRLMIARAKALQALRQHSEVWYSEAIKMDYSHVPSHRRIATLTMPKELPFDCRRSEQHEAAEEPLESAV